jgi:hypothetical protein
VSGGPTTVYTAGMPIETNHEAEGSLGCFAHAAGNPAERLLLSAGHVLFGDGFGDTGIGVYQPRSTSSWCRHQRLGTTRGHWEDGFRGVQVRVHSGGAPAVVKTGYETDAAVATVGPQIRFANTLPGGIGDIQGTPPGNALGVAVGPPFGQLPQAGQLVRMYSVEQKTVRWGTVFTVPGVTGEYVVGGSGPVPSPLFPDVIGTAIDDFDDAVPNINMFFVLPRPPPDPAATTVAQLYAPFLSTGLWFGVPGDSGSVVVNQQNQVVGMLVRAGSGRALAGPDVELRAVRSFGAVTPIGKVLSQLNITIPGGGWSPAAPSAGADAALALEYEQLARAIDATRQELSRSPAGALVLEKLDRHGRECRRLVNRVRRVTLAWHRSRGPAFLHHALESLRDPGHRIPRSIDGAEWRQLLDTMQDVLAEHGSDELRADLERWGPLARERLSDLTSLRDAPRLLADAPVMTEVGGRS